MKRLISCIALAVLLAPAQAAAQAEAGSQVYAAYYKIGYADMAEWIAGHFEYEVPVLEQLRDEGIIQTWAIWQHMTGGEYNWRFAVITDEWSKFDTFWEEYLGRWEESAKEHFDWAGEIIQAHYDEVWDLTEVHFPEDASPQYMYDSSYQISFSDMEEWNANWAALVAPVLNQAMEDGALAGWAIEGHNTGGRHNWKVLYFFDEWDQIDDLFALLEATWGAEPALFEQAAGMVDSHDDVIWQAVPVPGGM
jgi:hypothetical protein